MPTAEAIATHFPNHRQTIAPAFWQVRNHKHVHVRPWSGRDMWARILDARKRKNDNVPAAPYNRNERARHPKPTGGIISWIITAAPAVPHCNVRARAVAIATRFQIPGAHPEGSWVVRRGSWSGRRGLGCWSSQGSESQGG